jgi:hypothetical protein
MNKYVVTRRISGQRAFLCVDPTKGRSKVYDLYWKILNNPIDPHSEAAVFPSVLDALRVSTWAPIACARGEDTIGPVSIVPLEEISPGVALAPRFSSGVPAPTFDQWRASVNVYTALQVLTAEVRNKDQDVTDGPTNKKLFDRVLIAYCESALNRFRQALEGGRPRCSQPN